MTIELNVFGTFKAGPWETREEILKAAEQMEWNPSTAELKIFAESFKGGKVEGAFDSINLLCSIGRNPPDRLNIFTHANQRYIYFSGWVVAGDVEFNTLRPQNALDVKYLGIEEAKGGTFKDAISAEVTYSQFRSDLLKSLTIYIYACHVALGPQLCQGIANYFQRPLRVFSDEIRYYPRVKGRDLAWEYSIGNKPKVKTFHELDKYLSAQITPSKQ